MTRRKTRIALVTLLTVLFSFSGCQKSPAKDVIVSKNDGSFESKIITPTAETVPTGDDYQVSYFKEFDSTDESVHFSMEIDQIIPAADTPITQVSSHFLTEEDAKGVANAIFPDATFFEAELSQTENLSKGEIQERIRRWSEYANINSLKSLYGNTYSDTALNEFLPTIRSFIENYTIKYETAPEEVAHTPCSWKMRKSLEYVLSPEERSGADLSDSNDEISAQFVADGIPYCFTMATRNRNDFKVNMISVYIYAGMGPINLDETIFHSRLTRTAEPAQEEIDAVKRKAEQILSDMNLGAWQIDECFVGRQDCGEATEYTIYVNAVPNFGNIPVLRRTQLTSLRNEDGYAAEQYYTDVNFAFSPDGRLISFNLFTPVECRRTVSDGAEVMSIPSLLERAQEHLRLTDSYAYGFGDFLPFISEAVQCNVTISELEYGLSRIKARDTEDTYYYVPSVAVKGDVVYVGKESGKPFYSSEKPENLLYINAMDGTIIS